MPCFSVDQRSKYSFMGNSPDAFSPARLPLFPGIGFLFFNLFVFFFALPCHAQKFEDPAFTALSSRQIDIPFEYQNNFIVVKVVFNDIFPLRFIFDTGAEYTILSKREITDLLSVDYQKRFTLQGADMRTELYAYLARGINLTMGNLRNINRSILVLEEDYFRFEEFSGIQIHGILGADMFRRFVVKINYKKRIISLLNAEDFRPPRGGGTFEMPVELYRSKPYITTQTTLKGDTTISTKLLLDTGASLALLLYTDTHPNLHLPEKTIPSNIGMGLGGFLQGYLGRVSQLKINDIAFDQVVTNFQELPEMIDSAVTNGRNGIIGNQLLRRFIITLDYSHERLFFSPDPGFKNKYVYDRSGLIIIAAGPNLTKFTIFDVVPNSPAAKVGIRRGDDLKTINGIPASFFSLEEVIAKFQRKEGKKVRIAIERNNVKLKKELVLEQLI